MAPTAPLARPENEEKYRLASIGIELYARLN
jgi:hypothetical protein